MKNPTQKEYFEQIIALAKANNRNDLADFAQSRIDLLDKKAASKKPTKEQKANEDYKAIILDILADTTEDTGLTASEVLKASDKFAGFSNQKISSLLKQLVDAEKISKAVLKGKKTVFFAVAEVDEEAEVDDEAETEVDDEVQALDGEITV